MESSSKPTIVPDSAPLLETPPLPRGALTSAGADLATAVHASVGDAFLDPNAVGHPLRRRPEFVPVPRPMNRSALESAVYDAMAAPSVAASYFLFVPTVGYTLDCSPLGVVLDAIVPEREALIARGHLPSPGQTQYGRVQRRLHIHQAKGARLRTTFFVRGDGLEFPKEGCWSGDFSPRSSYRLLVHQLGLAVYPQVDGGTVLPGTLGGPDFGELLGEIRVGMPAGGARRMEYMCY